MIGQLKGVIAETGAETAIIDVGGVGYEVSATSRALTKWQVGSAQTLSVETLVAETYIRLVAFETKTERSCFRLLQSVQGVGAKAALAILSVLAPGELFNAIAAGNKTAIARAQGVGPKLAQRVCTELKDKVTGAFGADLPAASGSAPGDAAAPIASTARGDAVAALVGLGYDEGTATRAVSQVPEDADERVEAIIKAALKGLSVR